MAPQRLFCVQTVEYVSVCFCATMADNLHSSELGSLLLESGGGRFYLLYYLLVSHITLVTLTLSDRCFYVSRFTSK